MACSKDRYAATYVVAPQLGPADCQVADFTDVQAAIAALPPTGGKIFVKAGTYPIKKTIRIQMSNVQIQGEGMGVTNLVADATTMAAGDYVLLYSEKPVDAEISTKHAGEVKQIVAVDATTGVITVDDQIFDTYLVTPDSAAMARITMLRNVTLSDFSVT